MKCRACDGTLDSVLSLGATPLANELVDPADAGRADERFPLELGFCPVCALLQITHVVPPARMFTNYPYFSSYSDGMVAHARALAKRMIHERSLGPDSLVVEVASNDGYLLEGYGRAGIPILGVEPAANIAAAAERRGVPTITAFFDAALARRLRAEGRAADVIHAHNVFAHVPTPVDFATGLRTLLVDDGRLLVEVPYLPRLVAGRQFDTIYHEHYFYFTFTSLARLLAQADLTAIDVGETPLHGGSILVVAAPTGAARPTEAALALLAREQAQGWDRLAAYAELAESFAALLTEVRAMVRELRAEGNSLSAYGAAAKGCMLLHHLDLPDGTLEFVVDRSPHKQGRLVPGSRLPIVGPETLLTAMPDITLLLAWNFADEILAQQAEYRRRGGRFLIPLPAPRLV